MTPEDPRHGTHRGYVVGCREDCCTRAHTRYMKLYRLGRIPQLIDPTGTVRRIQALYALGWTSADIGEQCGRGREWARMIARSTSVTTTTADRIVVAYEALSMRLPHGGYANRSRRHAQRMGWAPPLAWDDETIDDPAATPRGQHGGGPRKTDLDPVVVERILLGEHLAATRAERHEVIRRWPDAINALERLRPDWNVSRDLREIRGEAS